MPQPVNGRYAALRRRDLRSAWHYLILSLILPVFAFISILTGWITRRHHPRQGWALVVLGTASLAAHAALLLIL